MDPNAALQSILRGPLVSEYAEALTQWLQHGGFAPDDTTVPNNPTFFVARHCTRHYPHVPCTTIRVRADKVGLWTAPPDGPWICLDIWFDLCHADWHAEEMGRAWGRTIATKFLNDRPEFKLKR